MKVKSIIIVLVLLMCNLIAFADEGNVSGLFKAPRITLKPYKLTLETNTPYLLRNFSISNKSLTLDIRKGYVVLGQTKVGPTEALIFAEDNSVRGNIAGTRFTNKVRKLMLRFHPAWYSNHFAKLLKRTASNHKYNKYLYLYHKKNFRHFYHNGYMAFLPPDYRYIVDFVTGNRVMASQIIDTNKVTYMFIGNNNLKRYWPHFTDGNITIYYPYNSTLKNKESWIKSKKYAIEEIAKKYNVALDSKTKFVFYVFNDLKQRFHYPRKVQNSYVNNAYDTSVDSPMRRMLVPIVLYNEHKSSCGSGLLTYGIGFYGEQSDINYDKVTAYLLQKGVIKDEEASHFNEAYSRFSLPMAASFNGYLLKTYGIEKYKKGFQKKSARLKKALKRISGKDFPELSKEWLAKLKKLKIRPLNRHEKDFLRHYCRFDADTLKSVPYEE